MYPQKSEKVVVNAASQDCVEVLELGFSVIVFSNNCCLALTYSGFTRLMLQTSAGDEPTVKMLAPLYERGQGVSHIARHHGHQGRAPRRGLDMV